jgi:hypothetical protein
VTTAERALFYKDSGFVNSYSRHLLALAPRRVFEFGIYQGGSGLFLSALLDLEKYVGIDLSAPVPGLAEILAGHRFGERIHLHFNTSQDSVEEISRIIETEFADGPPDLIIDDASHHYDLTKKSFEIAFSYLKDGGHYIIEDWSWAHWPENQHSATAWGQMTAMSNLILELTLLLPSTTFIEDITVRQGYVVLTKKSGPPAGTRLEIDRLLRLRGRELGKI